MKFKYLYIFLISIFMFTSNVYADKCDNADIERLKVLAKNIDITYEYNDDIYDGDGFKIFDTYKVVFNNMSSELYIKETRSDTDYSDLSVNDGVAIIDRIYSGKKNFKIYSKECNKSLKTYYITLPKFNYYYTDPNCEGKSDLDVCSKFYDTSDLEYSEFYNIILKYENDKNNIDSDDTDIKDKDNKIDINKYIKFLLDNYIYIVIGIGIVVILVSIILILRHKKRGVLE